MNDLDYLNLHSLLLKMKAECENVGICGECDCISLCPFAFTGTDGGPAGEPWSYLDLIGKEEVVTECVNVVAEIHPGS